MKSISLLFRDKLRGFVLMQQTANINMRSYRGLSRDCVLISPAALLRRHQPKPLSVPGKRIHHLEHGLAGLLMAGQVGQEGADLIRERVLWIQKVLKQHWKNFDICQQNLGETQPRTHTCNMFVFKEEINKE